MMLWSMYRVQCVLTLVITVTLHRSYAELFCNFGERTWSSDAGLNECGITQPSSSPAWGATSGRGYNGNAPSGGANDGFLLTTGGRGNMQIQAMFQLPNPNLQQNSGLLSFHFKFFDPGESILTISVCGLIIDDVNLQSNGNWELVENIRIYCHGYEPTVTFTALWSLSSGRVAVDNIRVVSTSPPMKRPLETSVGEIFYEDPDKKVPSATTADPELSHGYLVPFRGVPVKNSSSDHDYNYPDMPDVGLVQVPVSARSTDEDGYIVIDRDPQDRTTAGSNVNYSSHILPSQDGSRLLGQV
ncbi:uncharacterized protein LOC105447425 [Strongylocentrotus purpuratus]|uniref:Uncharacterized protein n=1 Tax=Strongylocentrotus purpuratus TaxID=7668 RepID=A0A7M7NQP7_STRPU|nr:uncharacterized protein LOC105447425 [Strongylocentrotus purpuratus]